MGNHEETITEGRAWGKESNIGAERPLRLDDVGFRNSNDDWAPRTWR